MANHIIHKQTFHLAVDAENQAHSVTEAVQETYYNKVLSAMDEVFTRLSPDDRIYRFDRLEIDIGQIGPENIETELAGRIAEMAEVLIRDKIDASHHKTSVDEGLEVIPDRESVFEAFLHFLQTGFLPWWFTDGNSKTPEELFRDISRHFNAQNISKFKSALKFQTAAKRLSMQFSETFKTRLFLAVAYSQKAKIALKEQHETSGIKTSGLISILLKEILAALRQLGISNEIQQNANMAMLQSFVTSDIAFRFFSKNHNGDKLPQEVENTISLAFRQLINILIQDGLRREEIDMLMAGLSRVLPIKSYTRFWLNQHKTDFLDLEKFVSATNGSTVLKNQFPEEDSMAEKQIEKLAEEGIYIHNAGLVIMWPFLNYYFGQLQLLKDGDFISPEKRAHAIQLLHYISTGNEVYPEQQLALNKIMCGMPLAHPFYGESEISENEKTETETLITTVIQKWEAIGRISVRGFRESFLMREGRLRLTDSGWMLKVNRNAYDLLLDRLPWSISMVKYKWMDKMIYVEW